MGKIDRVIIEVSDQTSTIYNDAITLRSLLQIGSFDLYCTNGSNHAASLDTYDDYNFVFIGESAPNLCETIEEIFTAPKNKNKDICISVHRSGGKLIDINSKISELTLNSLSKNTQIAKNKGTKDFIHEPDDPLWDKGLRPLVESIRNNFKDYHTTFDNLWNLLAPSPTDKAHSLRSQILTPFVALHLVLQDSFDENGKLKNKPLIFDEECEKECKKCCEDIEKQELPDQFKDATDMHGKLRTKIAELCQIIEKGDVDDTKLFKKLYEELCTAGKSGNDLIVDFAEMLEGVINRADLKKKIITLRHNIKNLLGTIDPNINALKNADKQAVREEWPIAKEAILRSGIDRVEKENKLYDEIRGMISRGNDIYEKLMEADKLYKVLFKAFSSNIEGDSIDSILKSGEALIQVLKDIIKKLEEMENA